MNQYAPPQSPALAQQRDALRKGLGRSLQWARSGLLDSSLLLEACLHDWRFDQQFEGTRGWWLWECMEALQCGDRFREPLLNALRELDNERDADQLCQLASEYACRGDQEFLRLLYGIVERQTFEEHLTAESELIDIDGEAAFLFTAKVRGHCLATRDWQWHDEIILDKATNLWGAARVSTLLAASVDSDVARFREAIPAQSRESKHGARGSHQAQYLAVSALQLIEMLESEPDHHRFSFRGWGMFAPDAELEVVKARMFQVTDESTLLKYLRVFSNRALPRFDPKLLALSEHSSAEVRRPAIHSLAMNRHPLVRARALQLFAAGEMEGLSLFIRNFEPGDEARFVAELTLPDDDFLRHSLLMDIKSILSENASAERQELGLMVYFSTPCGQCRQHICRLSIEHSVYPDWLREECRFDAERDTRELFEAIHP